MGACCCCEGDGAGTAAERKPLFGTSVADTQYHTTAPARTRMAETVAHVTQEALRAATSVSVAAVQHDGAQVARAAQTGSTALAAEQQKDQSLGADVKSRHGGDHKSASGAGAGAAAAAAAADPPRHTFNRRFTTVVHALTPLQLQNLDTLYKVCTQRDDLRGTIDQQQFERLFAPLFPDIGGSGSGNEPGGGGSGGMAVRLFQVLSGTDDSAAGGAAGAASAAAAKPTITYRQLVTALGMWSGGSMADRLRLLFDLWDSDHNGSLSRDELGAMIRCVTRGSSATGALLMRQTLRRAMLRGGGDDDDEDVGGAGGDADADPESGLRAATDEFLDSFIARLDSEFAPDGAISFAEWMAFAADHPDMRSFLAAFEVNPETIG